MKNISSLLIISFLFLPFFIYAQEELTEDEPNVDGEHSAHHEFRIADGAFEVGLNAKVGFANNALALNKIFNKTLVLDLDELSDGLKVDLDICVIPMFFNYDSKRGWGVGLSIGAEAAGILDITGDLPSKKTDNSKSTLNGAIFASIGIDYFYMIQKFKVKFRPALYSTLAYIKSEILYVNKIINDETQYYIDLDMEAFTAFSPLALGFDYSTGVEYPLSREIGLSDKFPILDFDVGIDFINIPIVPSTLKDYTKIKTSIGSKEPISMENIGDLISSFESEVTSTDYGDGKQKVYRPFKALVWANWYLYPGELPLSIIPTIGFSINPFFINPAAIEAGVKAHLLLANHFLFDVGIGYFDRLWKNSLDITLIFKIFEFYIGADLRSQDFVKSWSGGFGLKTGFKFKWGGKQPH